MTEDQLAFAREHGITHCPPSPTFRVSWGAKWRGRGKITELSEEDHLSRLVRGGGVVAYAGVNLAERRFGYGKRKKEERHERKNRN